MVGEPVGLSQLSQVNLQQVSLQFKYAPLPTSQNSAMLAGLLRSHLHHLNFVLERLTSNFMLSLSVALTQDVVGEDFVGEDVGNEEGLVSLSVGVCEDSVDGVLEADPDKI